MRPSWSNSKWLTAKATYRRWCLVKTEAQVHLRHRILSEVLSWAWVAAAFLLIHGTLVQARVIPSGSMERTLLVGDHLLMSRFGYDAGVPFTGWHVRLWREPHRQQVVIFRAPLPGTPDYVKRVIGLPGDTLEIHRGVVWVNGQPLAERYLNEPPNPRENLTAVKVPPESYFVMGDNRENSYDSRFWGFVPRSAIVGTPLVIYMSLQAPEGAWDAGQIHERLYAYLNAVAHPRLVRWKRLFTTF
ncbi:MAG: signal peptidase I [Acidobacteria bacterium]|nr:MAG: signal peptidase I [Acidobacteriota bacterium]